MEEEALAGRSGTLRPAGAWKIRQRRSPAFDLLRRVLCGEAEGRGDGGVGGEGEEGGKRGADAEEAAENGGGRRGPADVGCRFSLEDRP